jgi:hypothetical protein
MQNSENEMNRHRLAVSLLLTFAFLMLSAGGAHAQWIFVARKVIGRVQSMTQSPAPDTPRYDVATVMLEADADKVYQTVIATIATHKDYQDRSAQRRDAQCRGQQWKIERRHPCSGLAGQGLRAGHRLGHSAGRGIRDIVCRGQCAAHLPADESGL